MVVVYMRLIFKRGKKKKSTLVVLLVILAVLLGIFIYFGMQRYQIKEKLKEDVYRKTIVIEGKYYYRYSKRDWSNIYTIEEMMKILNKGKGKYIATIEDDTEKTNEINGYIMAKVYEVKGVSSQEIILVEKDKKLECFIKSQYISTEEEKNQLLNTYEKDNPIKKIIFYKGNIDEKKIVEKEIIDKIKIEEINYIIKQAQISDYKFPVTGFEKVDKDGNVTIDSDNNVTRYEKKYVEILYSNGLKILLRYYPEIDLMEVCMPTGIYFSVSKELKSIL